MGLLEFVIMFSVTKNLYTYRDNCMDSSVLGNGWAYNVQRAAASTGSNQTI